MRDGLAELASNDRADIARQQSRKLADMLAVVADQNPFYARKLSGIDLAGASVNLARLPLTMRAELEADQREHPPYGSNLTFPESSYRRLHQTSGSSGRPLRWLDTAESWDWFKRCWRLVMAAAGLTAEDRVFIPFSFGPFVGFWAAFEAAADMGCFVLPAGGMSTSARLRYLQAHRADIVCCTPTYALRMAEVAEVDGVDLASGSVRCLIVGGEPGGSIPATRSRIETAWGARVFDHAGSTEAGAWGFETVQDAGILQVNELEFVSEVLDTETLVPVDAGQEGELVLTNLGRLGSPLIRYRTGDRVRLASGQSDRGAMRLEGGILGRVDDMILVRGVNVFPSAIEGIVRRYAEISEFVIIWNQSSSQAELSVNLEIPQAKRADEVVGRVEADIRNDLHIRAVVSVIPAGSLPKSDTKSRRLIKRVDPGISENVARKQT